MLPANKSILRAVSRSFYLSIRFLPTRLREPVTLGYLLARSTDTVADTATVPVKTRIETLRRLSETIQHGNVDRTAIVDSFVPLQTNPAERTLLQNMVDDVLGQFVEAVARGRSMKAAQVRALADRRTGVGCDQLIFGILVLNTGDSFVMGPGSRNLDGIAHVSVDYAEGSSSDLATLGFEDLFGGGDFDYNDASFLVEGGIGLARVPEPASLTLLLLGLAAVVLLVHPFSDVGRREVAGSSLER